MHFLRLIGDIIPGKTMKRDPGDESWIQRYRTSGNMVISYYPSSYVKTWPTPVTAWLFDEEDANFWYQSIIEFGLAHRG